MATPFSESEEKKPLLSSISTETATSFRGAGGAITGYHATHSPVSRIERHGDVRGRREALFLHSAEGQGQWFADTNRAKVALILVTICYFLGYIPSMVIMNPYIYDRVSDFFIEESLGRGLGGWGRKGRSKANWLLRFFNSFLTKSPFAGRRIGKVFVRLGRQGSCES